jgi:hypothetical protein
MQMLAKHYLGTQKALHICNIYFTFLPELYRVTSQGHIIITSSKSISRGNLGGKI